MTGTKEETTDGNGKEVPQNASEAYEIILSSVGSDGPWQRKTAFIVTAAGLFLACHNLGAIFLGATPKFACDNPYLRGISANESNRFEYDLLLNFTTPWVTGNKGEKELSSCYYYDREKELHDVEISLIGDGSDTSRKILGFPQLETSNSTDPAKIKCSNWIYDTSVFQSTVVTEWDLVCDNQWLKPTIQASYMFGILTGAVIGSGLSDRFGRRKAMLGCAAVFSISSIIAIFSNSLAMFLIFRYILGAAGQGLTLIRFVMMLEMTGPSRRDFYGNVGGLGWTAGYFLLFVFSYFLRDWRSLQMIISLPTVCLVALYWFLPESPRWLMMKGRTEEGLEALEKIGLANGGKKLPDKEELELCINIIKEDVLSKRKTTSKSLRSSLSEYFVNVYSLVKTPNMRRRSLIMFYSWFVVSMAYYGVIFSGENIEVSLHVLTCISSLSGIPALFISYYSAIRFGRRITMSYAFICAGIFLIIIIFVPTDLGWINLILVNISRLFLGLCFKCVFFFSSELVPTNIRNTAMGICSLWARIGSMGAPYVVDLMGAVYYAIPSTIFGVLSIVAGFLGLLLPEVAQRRFEETIQQIELLPR